MFFFKSMCCTKAASCSGWYYIRDIAVYFLERNHSRLLSNNMICPMGRDSKVQSDSHEKVNETSGEVIKWRLDKFSYPRSDVKPTCTCVKIPSDVSTTLSGEYAF
ncbi:hypothetical protein CRM22_007725, partial [Opisthorchis felineus]